MTMGNGQFETHINFMQFSLGFTLNVIDFVFMNNGQCMNWMDRFVMMIEWNVFFFIIKLLLLVLFCIIHVSLGECDFIVYC